MGLINPTVTQAGATSRGAGALVATLRNGARVDTSYATGGRITGGNLAITNSYCDPDASGQTACIGSGAGASAPAITTADLQTPTGYTGIYVHWNLDLDANNVPDYPWNFGATTSYPTLHTPAQRAALIPNPANYDTDGNNRIEISNLAQLNAIRWDANGDGDPDAAGANAYRTAFPGRTAAATARMGCPATCMGYELTASLTFSSATTSPYRDWTPIATFNAEFDGNGHTLINLYIPDSDGDTGLFGQISGPNGIIRNVGLINPIVLTTGANQNTGALTGVVAIGGGIDTSYVSGGAVFVGGDNARAGGLAGLNRGRIRASYATANVEPLGNQAGVSVGGLVGHNWNAEIIASYAAGVMGSSTGTAAYSGGLVGRSDGNSDTITDSYCDLDAARLVSDAASASTPTAPPPRPPATTPPNYSSPTTTPASTKTGTWTWTTTPTPRPTTPGNSPAAATPAYPTSPALSPTPRPPAAPASPSRRKTRPTTRPPTTRRYTKTTATKCRPPAMSNATPTASRKAARSRSI